LDLTTAVYSVACTLAENPIDLVDAQVELQFHEFASRNKAVIFVLQS
jgi:hypothetical protein